MATPRERKIERDLRRSLCTLNCLNKEVRSKRSLSLSYYNDRVTRARAGIPVARGRRRVLHDLGLRAIALHV